MDHISRVNKQNLGVTCFEFVVRTSGAPAPLMAGSLYAADERSVPIHVRSLMTLARHVQRTLLGEIKSKASGAFEIETQIKSIPLLNTERLEELDDAKPPVYALELALSGPYFGLPYRPPASSDREDQSQQDAAQFDMIPLIEEILATDPVVRCRHAVGQKITWYMMSHRDCSAQGVCSVALHVTADEEVISVSPATAMASLLMLLCMVRQRSHLVGEGAAWKGSIPVPASATLRAAVAVSQSKPDQQRAVAAAPALGQLDTLGLHELAEEVAAQAVAAVPLDAGASARATKVSELLSAD